MTTMENRTEVKEKNCSQMKMKYEKKYTNQFKIEEEIGSAKVAKVLVDKESLSYKIILVEFDYDFETSESNDN